MPEVRLPVQRLTDVEDRYMRRERLRKRRPFIALVGEALYVAPPPDRHGDPYGFLYLLLKQGGANGAFRPLQSFEDALKLGHVDHPIEQQEMVADHEIACTCGYVAFHILFTGYGVTLECPGCGTCETWDF